MAEPIDLPFRLWTRVGRRKKNFNRIRQVASICPHGRANCRHLANTIEPSVCGGHAALCQIALTTCFRPYYVATSDSVLNNLHVRSSSYQLVSCLTSAWSQSLAELHRCAVLTQVKRTQPVLADVSDVSGSYWLSSFVLRQHSPAVQIAISTDTVLLTVCPPVCLSVCLSRAGATTKPIMKQSIPHGSLETRIFEDRNLVIHARELRYISILLDR